MMMRSKEKAPLLKNKIFLKLKIMAQMISKIQGSRIVGPITMKKLIIALWNQAIAGLIAEARLNLSNIL